jgi:hypothetical protein
VWRRTKSQLIGVERAGLAQDRAGDGDLADVVKLRGDHHAFDLILVEVEATRDLQGEPRHFVGVPAQFGVGLVERAAQRTRALEAGHRRLHLRLRRP